MTAIAINGLGRIGRAAFKITPDTPAFGNHEWSKTATSRRKDLRCSWRLGVDEKTFSEL
jgi:hypothetical protein